MLSSIIQNNGEYFAHNPAIRGYNIIYRENEINHCPGCGRSHWYIGRLLAECGFCGTAIPLGEVSLQGATGGHSRNRRMFVPSAYAA